MTSNEEISDDCGFAGCPNKRVAAGYCSTHNQQQRKGQELTPVGQKFFKPEAVCSEQDCDNIRWSGGLCRSHYFQRYRGKPLTPVLQKEYIPCNEANCTRQAITRGKCQTHYNGMRKNSVRNRRCSFEGCDKPHDANGYCKGHDAQRRAGRELKPLRVPGAYSRGETKCAISWCTKHATSRDLCASHMGQAFSFKLTNEELETVLSPRACSVCGETRRLCINRDHETGKVRGLLCGWCNTTLGHAKDDVSRLEGLIKYLGRTS